MEGVQRANPRICAWRELGISSLKGGDVDELKCPHGHRPPGAQGATHRFYHLILGTTFNQRIPQAPHSSQAAWTDRGPSMVGAQGWGSAGS